MDKIRGDWSIPRERHLWPKKGAHGNAPNVRETLAGKGGAFNSRDIIRTVIIELKR